MYEDYIYQNVNKCVGFPDWPKLKYKQILFSSRKEVQFQGTVKCAQPTYDGLSGLSSKMFLLPMILKL